MCQNDSTGGRRPRHRAAVVLAAGLLCVAATAHAQSSSATLAADSARSRALAGCYQVTLGPWSMLSRLGAPSPTTRFRLDSFASGVEGVAVRLAPDDSLPASDPRAGWQRPGQWRLIRSDSIVVTPWRTATEAEVFFGHLKGTDLEGVVRLTSDAVPVEPGTHHILWDAYPTARATATRVPCPLSRTRPPAGEASLLHAPE